MPTPLFTPGDEKQDERLNPGQQDADRRFGDLSNAEKQGTIDNDSSGGSFGSNGDTSQEDADLKKLQDKESSGSANSGWANNVNNSGGKTKQKFTIKNFAKKKGPLAAILAALGIGGFGMTVLFGPAMLLVNMKETMANKFNDQLSSLDIRSNRVMAKKIGQSVTSGSCSTVTIRCKFQTMSKRQIAKLETAGIKALDADGNQLTSRGRAASLEIDGRQYNAQELQRELRSNPTLRSAFNRAYNPKVAAFSDAISSKTNTRLKISKRNNLDSAASKEELNKKMRNGVLADNFSIENDPSITTEKDVNGNDVKDADGNNKYINKATGTPLSEEDIAARQSQLAQFDAETKARASLGKTGETMTKSTIKSAALVTGLGAGAVDSTCTGYRMIRTVGFAAKYIGMLQLARYAYTFMNTADAIKAGDATPEQVEYLGNIVTSTNSQGKSATDSYGYGYAAYGDVGGKPTLDTNTLEEAQLADETLRYTNGQLVSNGAMAKIISFVSNGGTTTAAADDACKFVKSGWGQTILIGTAVAGAAVAIFSGGVSLGWGTGVQIAASTTLAIAIASLTPKLSDMASGTLVTGDENGNEAGNAITSGMGAYNAQSSQSRGLAVLTKEDAVAYQNLTNETVALYDAVDRLEADPLDVNNQNSFVGSFVSKLLPHVVKNNTVSISGSVLGSFSAATNSLASTFTTKAATADEFNQCDDPEYAEVGLAADPFCNLKYGMSAAALDTDPETVLDYMINNGHIDENTGDAKSDAYKKYITTCVDRTNSIGGYSEGEENAPDPKGYECIQGYGENAARNDMFRLYIIDKSIVDEMDGEDEAPAPVAEGSLPTGSAPELAATILASGNVTDRTGQLAQIVSGSRTNVSPDILSVVAALSSSEKFTISSMKRDQALGVGAGNRSLHLSGRAVDFSGSAGVNGVSFGYNGHDATVQAFLDKAASVMPPNCDIGVPNQAYVNATKPKVKSGCTVFVDRGSAPHIHLDVKGSD